jgi:hypothetical protein
MIYREEIEFENVVQADPTLRFFLREATLDFDKLEHQTNLMGSAVVIAISKWIDQKYK